MQLIPLRARRLVGVGTAGLLFALPAPTAHAASVVPSYGPSVSSSAGDRPTSLVAADLTGEGRPDLAVTDSAGQLNVLPGDGSGFFPSRFPYPVGGVPTALLAAPLRTGGPLDLAISTGDTVVVLSNNGVGDFLPGPVLPVGTAPSSVATADVNGDGSLDLLTSNSGSGNVSLLLGDGAGNFFSGGTVPAGASPSGLDVGDLNGDGYVDVVVSNAGSEDVSVLIGNGDGSFVPSGSTPTGGSGPSSILLSDLNDDARPDAVVTDGASDDLSVLLGMADGSLEPAVNTPVATPAGPGQQPVATAATDLNGDGHTDVAVLNAASATIGVLLGNGTGALEPATTLGSGGGPTWMLAADLDGDQRPDLAVSSSATDAVVTRLNTTPFPLSSPLPDPPAVPTTACGHHALLSGRLTATAYPTTWYFEYRQVGRWRRSPGASAGPDDDPQEVSAHVSGLRPGKVLKYRLVLRSAGHLVRGPVLRVPVLRRCE